jgi:subtilisin family serine protease
VRGAGRAPSDPRHGTAVAALLIGARGSSAPGLLPGTRLLAVDAFHRSRLGLQRMDAFDLVAALDTLNRRGVRVINLSFAGADNRLLAESVRRAAARRVILVAAVGNDGPTATPRFPAAYAEVIAVTAVGAGGEAYRQAGRGPHVELAAPGVDVLVADARDPANRRALSGTSYAAPYVTAAAGVLAARSPSSVQAVRARLLATASDLGAAGVDPVFGHGLLQAGPLCSVRR